MGAQIWGGVGVSGPARPRTSGGGRRRAGHMAPNDGVEAGADSGVGRRRGGGGVGGQRLRAAVAFERLIWV
jgi:hypothetical protein